jgi:hypothetical protein
LGNIAVCKIERRPLGQGAADQAPEITRINTYPISVSIFIPACVSIHNISVLTIPRRREKKPLEGFQARPFSRYDERLVWTSWNERCVEREECSVRGQVLIFSMSSSAHFPGSHTSWCLATTGLFGLASRSAGAPQFPEESMCSCDSSSCSYNVMGFKKGPQKV